MSKEGVEYPTASDGGKKPSFSNSTLLQTLADNIAEADENGELFFLATQLSLRLVEAQKVKEPITIVELKRLIVEAARAMVSE
jgi:hypothetical protein